MASTPSLSKLAWEISFTAHIVSTTRNCASPLIIRA